MKPISVAKLIRKELSSSETKLIEHHLLEKPPSPKFLGASTSIVHTSDGHSSEPDSPTWRTTDTRGRRLREILDPIGAPSRRSSLGRKIRRIWPRCSHSEVSPVVDAYTDVKSWTVVHSVQSARGDCRKINGDAPPAKGRSQAATGSATNPTIHLLFVEERCGIEETARRVEGDQASP